MKTEIWDLFHDGNIVGIEGNVPGDLLLKIEIKWLKKLFSKENDCFFLKLVNCKLFEFKAENEEKVQQDIQTIEKNALWIEDSEESDGTIIVYCHEGILKMIYDHHVIFLDKERTISEKEIRLKLDSDQSWMDY